MVQTFDQTEIMYRCLSVGMRRAYGNPNSCIDLDEILHTHPHLSKEGFDLGLTLTPWAWGLETL